MKSTPSFYEHSRDNQQAPACWRRENNSCFPHFHNSLELVYVRSGVMEATLGGKAYRVESCQLLVVPSYTVHLYSSPQGSDTYVLTMPMDYIVSFQSLLKNRVFSQYLLTDSRDTKEIQHCMQALCNRTKGLDDCPVSKGYIYVIMGLLLERVPLEAAASHTDSGQIQKILGYLHRNYQAPLTLEHLALEFGYSGSRFSHIFNENVGCSISHYINTLRCRSAAALLREHRSSVLDAAMTSGFESMRTFYRAFRRCYGMTPSQYLELSRTAHPSGSQAASGERSMDWKEGFTMLPLKMRPAFKDYLWGGVRLREEYGKDCDLSPVAESWELSCHPDGLSTVVSGPYAGKTLAELLEAQPAWIGSAHKEFPLLIKLIDARQSLSIQVHPNDSYARRVERQQGKNEMWYVMDAAPGAQLVIGLTRPVDKEELRERIEKGTLEAVTRQIPVKAGDCFCIPAGMLHAIGAGLLIAEVQQNSNVTYRVYDFGRRNPDGTLRELHVDKALDVIDATLSAQNVAGAPTKSMQGYTALTLTHWSYFSATLLDITHSALLHCSGESCHCLLCVDGQLSLSAPADSFVLAKGESAFLPAGLGAYSLVGEGKVLLTEL